MLIKSRKLISTALCMLLILSSIATGNALKIYEDNKGDEEYDLSYNLASSISEGNILHCSNTYLSQITDMLPQIARQGFSAVQVSPVQGNKRSINSGAYFCDWTFYYQPVNFKVGNELGTAEDLKTLCEKAHEYGIKVIVDIVSNHMAQSDDGRSGSRSEQIEAEYNKDEYFHSTKRDASNKSRAAQVSLNVGGLPDLNTSNKTVQGWVYQLLEDCVALGADGFRFDTAKHIETPSDGELASDFWTNTAVKIKNKYKDLYIYGEVVDLSGTVGIDAYTNLMNVTDAGYGISTRRDINKGSVASLSKTSGVFDDVRIPTGKGVVWVESHDEFLGGTTTLMSEDVLIKTYAAMASRKDDPTLFFPRPIANNIAGQLNWDSLIGQYTETWLCKEIREVNMFKNAYEGQGEELSSYQDKYYLVKRGSDGVCIVNVSDSENINIPVNMPDGSYKDQISGNMFTVSKGYISGKMAKSGVAVVYNKKNIPTVSVNVDGKDVNENDTISFTGETTTVTINTANADKCEYKLAGNEPEKFSGSEKLTFGKGIDSGMSVPLTIKAYYGSNYIEAVYYIDKKDLSAPHIIYFDAPAKAFYEKTEDNSYSAGVPYVLEKDSDDKPVSNYPGKAMTKVENSDYEHLYSLELDNKTAFVKFNDGVANDVSEDAHTLPPTESVYGDASLTENRIKGGYSVSGSMLWRKGKLINVKQDGKPYDVCTDVIELESENIEITTDSDKNIITVKEEVVTPYLYGDVDVDGYVNMTDVTLIQKNIAKLVSFEEIPSQAADADGNKEVNLEDVVSIQKLLAKLIGTLPAGEKFDIKSYIEYTTETDSPDTDSNTNIDTDTQKDTDSSGKTTNNSDTDVAKKRVLYFKNTFGWDAVYAHFWENMGSEFTNWPGTEMTSVGDDVYMIEIPEDQNANMIIFNDGGNGNQTENLSIRSFGLTFVPNGNTGKDNFGNTLVYGKWQ